MKFYHRRERRLTAAVRRIEEHLNQKSTPNFEGGDDSGLALPPLPLFQLPVDALCGSMLDDAGLIPGRSVEVFCEGLLGEFIVRDDEVLVRQSPERKNRIGGNSASRFVNTV